MSKHTTQHAGFVIERKLAHSPAAVFKAFANPKAKAKWFAGPPEWHQEEQSMDFRVGGKEVTIGGPKGGPAKHFVSTYQDIIPNERIVYTYEMKIGENRISVSLATLEFKPAGSGTLLTMREQGVFLDGYDDPAGREAGSQGLLDALEASLEPVS